jgi:hypothetical protein
MHPAGNSKKAPVAAPFLLPLLSILADGTLRNSGIGELKAGDSKVAKKVAPRLSGPGSRYARPG